jgi:hypothetical protein
MEITQSVDILDDFFSTVMEEEWGSFTTLDETYALFKAFEAVNAFSYTVFSPTKDFLRNYYVSFDTVNVAEDSAGTVFLLGYKVKDEVLRILTHID